MTRPVRSDRLLATIAAITIAVASGMADEIARRPRVHLRLEPQFTDAVSGLAWNATLDEVRRIWSSEGVAILVASDPAVRVDVTLPLIVDERGLRRHDGGNRDALGITSFHGRQQEIRVSPSRARRALALRRGLADSADATTLDLALGRVLGRVIAHEIGHVLLLTKAHSTQGLMSPRLVTTHALTSDSTVFVLSATERARLTQRFSSSPSEAAPLTLAEARDR